MTQREQDLESGTAGEPVDELDENGELGEAEEPNGDLEEPEEGEAEEQEGVEGEPAGGRRLPAFAAGRRLFGRGRLAEPEPQKGRVGAPVRGAHVESRVHIDDRASAIYALISALALLGLLVWALTFAPTAFLNNAQPSVPPLTLGPSQPAIAPTSPSPAASAAASASAAATPSASASPSAGPSATPSASGS